MKTIYSKHFRGKRENTFVVSFRLHNYPSRFRAIVLTGNGELPEQVLQDNSPYIVQEFKIEEQHS